jgi:CheY-like chemotaxis protein/HPt (histidine-containing phosphotransfer) domain-containing protein/Na+-transporting methylmalonyl-CoA/oxaloacetate decarboxylase gamma subunit
MFQGRRGQAGDAMNWKASSLRRRLLLMLAGMAFAVLALALLIFTVAGTLRQQGSMMSQLRSLAHVVAANAEAAVVFGDEQAAAVNLASLREHPEVVAARIVLPDGRLLAAYPAGVAPDVFARLTPNGFERGLPLSTRPLRFDYVLRPTAAGLDGAETLGTLSMVVDPSEMWRQIRRDSLTTAGLGVLVLLLAVLAAQRLQHRISEPVLRLAAAAREVAESQRYDQHIPAAARTRSAGWRTASTTCWANCGPATRACASTRSTWKSSSRAHRRAARRQGAGRSRQPGQERVPRHHEPRDPHPDERRARHDRAAAGLPARPHPAALRRAGPAVGAPPAGHHQRHPRFLEDRVGPHRARSHRLRPGRARRGQRGHVRPAGRRKGLELASQLSPPNVALRMRGDAFRLRQVLANLLNNAIKFTRQGEVVVRAQVVPDGEHMQVSLSVEDTGVGISAAAREKIFEHFSQADGSTTREFGGTGLGLAISRRLVELMGGRIGVDSEVGKGSRFHIELRLPRAASPAEAPESATTRLEGARVLVVDDNLTNLDILRLQLGGWGMQVHCAESGAQALEALHEAAGLGQPFDLAILDMHMPGMDGLQLAQAIHAEPALAPTRLIMLTSTFIAGNAREREEAGILRCVSKPVRQAELRHVVGWALAPAARRPRPGGAHGQARPGGLLHGHVLLAEDNPVNQELARAMLQKLGLTVAIAQHGEEALALAAAQAFDAILMDCQMPVMDGYQATALLRAREGQGGHHLPVIALTANAMEGDRDQCLAAGMDDYLAKPYTTAQLEATLQRWLPTGRPPRQMPPPRRPPPTPRLPPRPSTAKVLEPYRELDPDGGWSLARRLLAVYLESSTALIHKLETAIPAGDASAAREAAHALKSSSANIGGLAAAEHFRGLEALAKAGQLDQAALSIGEARAAYAALVADVHALLDETA